MSAKHASSYRYKIQAEAGTKPKGTQSRPAKAAAPAAFVVAVPAAARSTAPRADQSGIDDLLSAAQKLGWQRVKEVVDGVLAAR